ncbi:hypothetical protein RvY_01681 [Ramazzottius varieornatus]|uniref:DDE-1 domain-containing protein n=1 Tax=Ramazzottius varieornatus TaxID=947166 RepID=A0A1D1UP80_RAMVA|nr:hypothetical protein RvY_01681 [Ramazzottius varieornatus]
MAPELRPLILYKGKMHIESHFRETLDACYVGTNSSRVMDTKVFNRIPREEISVIHNLSQERIDFRWTFLSSELRRLSPACTEHEKEIQVVVLSSGQTAFLQPVDKEVFGGVKQKWHMYLRDSRLDTSIDVSRHNFAAHIVKLWNLDFKPYSFNLGKTLPPKVTIVDLAICDQEPTTI